MSDQTTDKGQDAPVEPVPRLALRPKEAARSLGIGVRLLWAETKAGRIPCRKIGRAVVYDVAALRTWLGGNENP